MRGVNKLVIEVRPEDKYFEKALLFLSPEAGTATQTEISQKADKFLSGMTAGAKNKTSIKHTELIFSLIGAAAGSLLSFIIVFITGIL